MIKNSFLKNITINLKYFKNNCVIKYKIVKNKKKKGENITFKDYLIEIGILKKNSKANKKPIVYYNNSIENSNKKTKINENVAEYKEYLINKKTLVTLAISIMIVIISFLSSTLIFNKSNEIKFFNITAENEAKISNVLKSPKTQTYINTVYIEEKNKSQIKYYFNTIDKLDSYSYKIDFNNISDDLKNELLQNNYKLTKEINSLDKIVPQSIVLHEDYYLINNKYRIAKEFISDKTLNTIEKNIEILKISQYNNTKINNIAFLTIIISVILNLIYFSIKRVISTK